MSKSWKLALMVESSYHGIVKSITKERTEGFAAGLSVGGGVVLAILSFLAIMGKGLGLLVPVFSLGLAIFLVGLYYELHLRGTLFQK